MSERKGRVDRTVETRLRVIDAARDLFVSQGYARTTTREIAAAAGVTERTVFNLVANKSELLREVLLRHVFRQAYGPLLERDDFSSVLQADSPERFLEEFSGWVTDLHQHTAVLAEVVRSATSVDPGAAEQWAWGTAQQVTDLQDLARLLHERDWLRPGLGLEEAAHSLAVLSGHETYWRLTTVLGWSPRQYGEWLRHHCAAELC